MAFSFTNAKGVTYYLHFKDVTLRGGKKQRIYFFARDVRDGSLDEVYKFDPSNGSSELLFTSPDLEDAFGMTYDGTYLWITDHATSSSNPAYTMQFDFTGNVQTQFDLPDHYMSGIAYDNDDFWVATYYPYPSTIYKVDNTGNVRVIEDAYEVTSSRGLN